MLQSFHLKYVKFGVWIKRSQVPTFCLPRFGSNIVCSFSTNLSFLKMVVETADEN